MTPGQLPVLDFAPLLERISPSRFVALSACTLRELWAASEQSPLLPASPRARLGTVVHRLLEAASNGLLVGGEESIKKAWSGIVFNLESRMSTSWIERSLVPLSRTVNDFEVQRLRAWSRAMQLMQSTEPAGEHTIQKKGFGSEIWVQSKDGTVGGYIDEVYPGESGPVIRDFKTGRILEDNATEDAAIHPDYLVQVKLYAALYHETFGRWPTHLELMPLRGEAKTMAVEQKQCEEILEAAKSKRCEVNSQIRASLSKGREGLVSLASPTAANCRFCLWRPGCSAYLERSDTPGDSEWPADIHGTVKSIQHLGNGRLLLIVRNKDGEEKKVRQLDPSLNRHPALAILTLGDQAGIFNTRRNPNSTDGSETTSTTIYRMS